MERLHRGRMIPPAFSMKVSKSPLQMFIYKLRRPSKNSGYFDAESSNGSANFWQQAK